MLPADPLLTLVPSAEEYVDHSIERYAYHPYGRVTILDGDTLTECTASLFDNPYTFSGRRLDPETGLYYYRARYYHAPSGRFLSRDPLGYVDGPGLYEYVSGGPLGAVDPMGQELVAPWDSRAQWWFGLENPFSQNAQPFTEQLMSAAESFLLQLMSQLSGRVGSKQDAQICYVIPSAPALAVCLIPSLEITYHQCCEPSQGIKNCLSVRLHLDVGLSASRLLEGSLFMLGPVKKPGWQKPRWAPKIDRWFWKPAVEDRNFFSFLKTPPIILGVQSGCQSDVFTFQGCLTGSAGFGTWTIGARVCRHYSLFSDSPARNVYATGMGVGHGTGIYGGVGVTFTGCL